MVLTLGYHRFSTMHADSDHERQSKILLFWMIYWFDSSFSVRLGRAPVIRDYDVTVPRLLAGSIVPTSFVDGWNYSITLSALQCQVVEQLYSPLALQQSPDERRERASRLVKALEEIWDGRDKVLAPLFVKADLDLIHSQTSPSDAEHPDYGGLHLLLKESDAVMHYSTVYEHPSMMYSGGLADIAPYSALVQHAFIANGESPALAPARQALRLNIDAWRVYKYLPDFIWSGHCHW